MRKTFSIFLQLVEKGALVEPFLVSDARTTTGLSWAGNFLAKHRVGNPRHETELFVRVETIPVRYRIHDRARQ